jgi:hypothetical protein
MNPSGECSSSGKAIIMARIWFAGVPGGGSPGDCKRERELSQFWSRRLHSYFHLTDTKGTLMPDKAISLFLDSGAFSAFTQGVAIDIQEYISFIREHEVHLEVYANLDVIGDPAGTWRNQQIMEEAGLKPLPCFHYGEDPRWLKRYLARGYDYIAFGGMVPISTADLQPWLDTLYREYICGPDGLPRVKVHGFGLTSLRLMMRYPWYSVDSTSWVMTGRMGSVYVPRRRKGTWLYDEESWKVCVSSRSPSKSEAGKHIDSFPPRQKQEILDYFDEKGYALGKSEFRTVSEKHELQEGERWYGKAQAGKREVELTVEPGLANEYKLRDELNIIYFLDLEKALPAWPWAFQAKGNGGAGFGV